jgi:hypothetical protein
MPVDHQADDDAYAKETLEDWKSMLDRLFPLGIPSSKRWSTASDIVDVLNTIGRNAPQNHMFFPNGGGMDLEGARVSHEPGAIELCAGFTSIVKPELLSFEYFGPESIGWSYFRLDTGGLRPSGVYDEVKEAYEEVTELSPAQYVNRSVWDAGYYGHDEDGVERPLPRRARCVSRFFEGAFVIFAKGSIYNRTSATYDGRHNKMNREQFRAHIKEAAEPRSRSAAGLR